MGAAGVLDLMNLTPAQARYYLSRARFNVAACGRRSGKTAIAKRRGVRKALEWTGAADARFVFGAPTQQHAKDIFWRDVKRLVPAWAIAGRANETELQIPLINGAIIQVAGMDKPQRVEGAPIAHACLDEFADMAEEVWDYHVFPALTDTEGSADLIGVPEGRNHYWDVWCEAQADETGEWAAHHWITAEVLPMYLGEEAAARAIARAQRVLDELTYQQEFEASFNNFEGRVYYEFSRDTHAAERLRYNPNRALSLCFDFNVSPGVCAYVQEQTYSGQDARVARNFTAVIGEVHIPRDSNTAKVCRRIAADWGPGGRYAHHEGEVLVWGDATGGGRSTKSEQGTDFDVIRGVLQPVFGDKLLFRNKLENPSERVRVNAVNARIRSASGDKHLLVDPKRAPKVVEDLESVVWAEGTNEIDKKSNKKITHVSDALGYYVEAKHPISGRGSRVVQDLFE